MFENTRLKQTDLLDQGLEALGLFCTQDQRAQLLDYAQMLLKWNKVYNLTAIRNFDEVITHHLLDSLSIVPVYRQLFGDSLSVLDVGSGGGLPAIPLAIMMPNYSVSMCDTVGKKCAFLTQASLTLNLKNTTVINNRVEKVSGIQFDVISSRAFASLELFTQLTAHLLKDAGCWLAMKGVIPQAEMSELAEKVLVSEVLPLKVPFLEEQRHLIKMVKHN